MSIMFTKHQMDGNVIWLFKVLGCLLINMAIWWYHGPFFKSQLYNLWLVELRFYNLLMIWQIENSHSSSLSLILRTGNLSSCAHLYCSSYESCEHYSCLGHYFQCPCRDVLVRTTFIKTFLVTYRPRVKGKLLHWTEMDISHYKKTPTLPRMYWITKYL